MKPIGPLMREHRNMEHMIALMVEEKQRIDQSHKADPAFIAAVVDYFNTYVDETHHRKEEEIQFKTLAAKNLTPELSRTMQELIEEHSMAREIVAGMDNALQAYNGGDTDAAGNIRDYLNRMIDLYPMHIEKEDKHFFYPTLDYLNQAEQDAMLNAFWEHDRNMIHEKYNRVVEEMKARFFKSPALSQNPPG